MFSGTKCVRNKFSGGLKSHQLKRQAVPPVGHFTKGVSYGYNYLKYGPQGYGITTYHVRTPCWPRSQFPMKMPIRTLLNKKIPMSQATTKLSHHWTPYALDDGGVLFIHPEHSQLMQWSHDVLREEAEAAGGPMLAGVQNTSARIQAFMEEGTLENASLRQWRRKQLWDIVDAKVKPGDVKGVGILEESKFALRNRTSSAPRSGFY